MLHSYFPEDIVKELGMREKQYRISFPMTQEELSDKSRVSTGSIRRFESGEGIQLTSLVRILKALGLEKNLDLLLPDPMSDPIRARKIEESLVPKERMRAGRHRERRPNSSWKWGDEK